MAPQFMLICVSAAFVIASSGLAPTEGLHFIQPANDELERESDTPVISELNPSTNDKKKETGGGNTRGTTGGQVKLPSARVSPVAGPNFSDVLVHEKEFSAPEVKVQMECQHDKTIIKLNFNKGFVGILGTGNLAASPCKIIGNGARKYELRVNHNSTECGSNWVNTTSSIFNNLSIRFHPTLETGSDIAKNLMCRLTVGDLVVGRKPVQMASPIFSKFEQPEASQ